MLCKSLTVHCRTHNSPPVDILLTHTSPHYFPFQPLTSLKIIPLRTHKHFCCPMHATCSVHPTFLHVTAQNLKLTSYEVFRVLQVFWTACLAHIGQPPAQAQASPFKPLLNRPPCLGGAPAGVAGLSEKWQDRNWCRYFKNVITVSRYTHKCNFPHTWKKKCPSLCRFSQKSQMPNSATCRSLVLNFTQIGR